MSKSFGPARLPEEKRIKKSNMENTVCTFAGFVGVALNKNHISFQSAVVKRLPTTGLEDQCIQKKKINGL